MFSQTRSNGSFQQLRSLAKSVDQALDLQLSVCNGRRVPEHYHPREGEVLLHVNTLGPETSTIVVVPSIKADAFRNAVSPRHRLSCDSVSVR